MKKGQKTNMEMPASSSEIQIRSNNPQGIMSNAFNGYIFRKISGAFYEVLREGFPVFDAAITRLTSLNGTIKPIGDKSRIVKDLEDFCMNVPVNDMQQGINSYQQNHSNETFEQGFSMGEFVLTKDMKDIAGLRVADSKHIIFRNNKDGKAEPWYRYPSALPTATTMRSPEAVIQRILNAQYGDTVVINGMEEIKLNPANKMYFSINNENSDPYGVSIMRSTEFISKIFATILNSIDNTWERFGDPSYHVEYVAATRTEGEAIETRRQKLATDFASAIEAKRAGKSADFVTAVGKDSSVKVSVIGGEGKVISAQIPARILLEQLISKTGLPAWLLGIYWSTTERMASTEIEMVLQDAKIRQIAMMPQYLKLCSIYLKLRGHKWNSVTTSLDKRGDWGLLFETPNVRDIITQAQARFLNAQADMMGTPAGQQSNSTTAQPGKIESIEINGIKFEIKNHPRAADLHPNPFGKCSCIECTGRKELTRPKPWPALDKIETEYENRLKADWQAFGNYTAAILRLSEFKDAKDGEVFTFTAEQRAAILKEMERYIGEYDLSSEDTPLKWYYGQAYSAGLIQAAYMIGKERPILDIIKNREIYEQLCNTGFTLLKDNVTRSWLDKILPELEAHVVNGSNPRTVASRLNKLFGDRNSDWERLARTEMSMAAETAKLNEWLEWDVKKVRFAPAPDACSICIALAGEYEIDQCPVPARDTHPRCRCSIGVR